MARCHPAATVAATIALALLGLGFMAWLAVQATLALISDLSIPLV